MLAWEWAGVVAVALAPWLLGVWLPRALRRWRARRSLARLHRRIAAGEDEVQARRDWMREMHPRAVAQPGRVG